jgi:di/tricarboxylate transporter
MEFENLRAIWNTQNERPVYSLDDSRLAVGLYQQREESSRRLFRQQLGPVLLALFIAVGNALVFRAFFTKTTQNLRFTGTDPRMSVWDGVALAGAAIAVVAVAVSRYIQRRRHERTQNVFAPSLREELERGIAQLDFEFSLYGKPQTARLGAAFSFGIAVFFWEFGRLVGVPHPWMMLPSILPIIFGFLVGFNLNKKMRQQMLKRRRALESMCKALDEDHRSLSTEIERTCKRDAPNI